MFIFIVKIDKQLLATKLNQGSDLKNHLSSELNIVV